MVDEKIRNAIYIEIHKSVKRAALSTIDFNKDIKVLCPPDSELLKEEKEALARLTLSTEELLGLKKLIVSACITPIFDFFCLLDGVADPEKGEFDPWLGLTISQKPEEDEPMFHDELYKSYWLFKQEKVRG
jgi:hypothetical protein